MSAEKRMWIGAALVSCALLLPAVSLAQVTWTGLGANQNYTTPGNWAGGIVPPNTGADSAQFSQIPGTSINVNTAANLSGLTFVGSSGLSQYYFYQGTGGSLTVGSGGISNTGGIAAYSLYYLPMVLSASQTWSTNGYIFADGPISETGGSRSLITSGAIYLLGDNSFTGGVTVTSGELYVSSNTAAGTGVITLSANTNLDTWYPEGDNAILSNTVNVGNGVGFGTYGDPTPSSPSVLTLAGTVALQNAVSTIVIEPNTTVALTGTLGGPPSTQLTISGYGGSLPYDGGSQVRFTGTLSNIASVTVYNSGLILAPVGPISTALAGLSPASLQLINESYLGLDGTFASTSGAVSTFVAGIGSAHGSNISGTIGFDTIAGGMNNTFSDAINLSNFSSSGFLGLGSSTAATLSGSVTPVTSTNEYVFGGGGGTLTVTSSLTNYSGTSLVMTAAPEPLTLILQNSNTYAGTTQSNGGVLVFDTALLPSGGISLQGGYVGETETSDITSNDFITLFSTNGYGVLGFDQAVLNLASPRMVTDSVDMSNFIGDSDVFLGTSTAAEFSGSITPANNQYQFTGVKGGRLTIDTALGDYMGATGVTIGLVVPIESAGSSSVVTLTGNNSYSGGTTINSGTVFFNSNTAFGTNGITVTDPGYSDFTPYFASYGGLPVTISNPISFGNIGGLNGYAGLTVGNAQPTGNDMLILSGILGDNGGTPGYLAIAGPVTLSAVNTYTGGTSIDGQGSALVLVTNPSSLGALTGPTGGMVTVQSYAILAPTGANVTLGNPFELDNPLTLGRNSDQTDILTLTGNISGGYGLTIDGPVVLSGDNTYSGGTIVDAVNLAIGNPNALGSGALQLQGAAQLTYSYANPTIYDLTDDDSGNSITLASGSTLTLYSDYSSAEYPASYWGAINGDMTNAVITTGPGAQFLGGNSTYGGGTTVASGILVAGSDNALGTGAVTITNGAQLQVNSGVTLGNNLVLDPSGGATLSGNGTFSPGSGVTIASGNIVAPGGGYYGQFNGNLSFASSVTFGSGGIYDFNVQDASGSPGSGYTTMNVSGAPLTLSISGSPFQIVVTSIDPSGNGPGFANFNSTLPYSWTLVTAPSITGTFNPSEFSINLSAFQNPLNGGSFVVGDTGNELTLNFTPVPEPSTWALIAAGLAAVLLFGVRRTRRA